MNLLCPNCNKMLTVPEQYAGQLMKCPLCSGTFTVPNMPEFAGPDLAPAFDSPPAPPPDRGTYGMEAAPAFQTSAASSSPPPPPEPAFAVSHPAPPPPPLPAPSPTPVSAPASAPPGPPAPAGYTTRLAVCLSDKMLQWVPPGCVVLIFFLTFFSWVGVYPGGVPATTQSAWGAAFGGYTQDKDMKNLGIYFPDEKELEEKNRKREEQKKDKLKDHRPGVSVLVLVYLLFFLPTLVITLGVTALNFTTITLPPAVQQFLPWRWAILFGLNVVVLLFLFLQLLTNFSIETNFKEQAMERSDVKKEAKTTEEEKKQEMLLGMDLSALRRTYALRLVLVLHVFSTLAAGLVYWVVQRGPGKPLPRVEALW